MSFINNHKTITVASELDLFSSKPLQSSIDNGYFQEYRPISILESGNAPIEFHIIANEDYIDLSHSQIYFRAKILHADNTPLLENDPVCPVNNFHGSLINHVSIELNGKCITPPSNSYHYRSYIEKLLTFESEAKQTHLGSGLWKKDEASKMDDVTGAGFVARKKLLHSGMIELSSYIHSELMCQNKYLISGVEMRIKFFLNKPEFSLLTTVADKNSYKIEILESFLLMRKVKINPSVVLAHERALTRGNVKLNIIRNEVKIITVSKDTASKSIDNIFTGECRNYFASFFSQ